jgi:hypothetical protein
MLVVEEDHHIVAHTLIMEVLVVVERVPQKTYINPQFLAQLTLEVVEVEEDSQQEKVVPVSSSSLIHPNK